VKHRERIAVHQKSMRKGAISQRILRAPRASERPSIEAFEGAASSVETKAKR
jgi:hypothetical protein